MWSDFVPHFAHFRDCPTCLPFTIAGIIQPGRYPQRTNNQDAVGIDIDKRTVLAFVSDGCASGSPYGKNERSLNEVGANLAVVIAVGAARRLLKSPDLLKEPQAFAQAFSARYLKSLWHLACHLAQSRIFGKRMRQHIILEFLMSTLLGIVLTDTHFIVLGGGDGVVALNGEIVSRAAEGGSYPLNELVVQLKHDRPLDFDTGIHCIQAGSTSALDNVMVASDGFEKFPAHAPLQAFLGESPTLKQNGYDRFFSKEFRSRVAMKIDDEGFHDDRSLVMLRRIGHNANNTRENRNA